MIHEPRSVYIAFDLFPAPKGSSTHIAHMLDALASCLPPVLVLCLGAPGLPALQINPDFISIHRYHSSNRNLLQRAQGFGAFVEERLARLRLPPDLIVFRDPWGGVPALAASPTSSTLFEVNGLPSWELPYSYPAVGRNSTLLEKLRDMEWFCLERADRIITVSGVTKRALAEMGVEAGKIGVVPNAAPLSFFRAGDRELEKRPEVLYAGSLQPWQGVETILHAYSLLKGKGADFCLRLVHNGKRRWLKGMVKLAKRLGIEELVKFQGPVEREHLACLTARALFTVAPLEESFRNTVQGCCPLKIVESLAAGTPVLASDLEVCRELVTHGRDGLLLPPGDARAWAIAMQHGVEAQEEMKAMGRKGREAAFCNLHPEVIQERLKEEFARARGES